MNGGILHMDNDVKQKFEEHTKILDKHSEEIEKIKEVQTKILVSQAEMNTKLSSIESIQYDIKKSITESTLAQRDSELKQREFEKELINKLIDNESNKQQNEQQNDSNKFVLEKYGDLFLKALGVLGIIYAGKEILMK